MPPSIHIDHLPGDEVAADEEHDRLGDITRAAGPLQRRRPRMMAEIALIFPGDGRISGIRPILRGSEAEYSVRQRPLPVLLVRAVSLQGERSAGPP